MSVVDLEDVPSLLVQKQQPTTWVSKPLTNEDRDALLSGDWLTDHLVNEGQRLIKKKYHANGLQDVSLGNTLAFNVMGREKFIQVLHTGKSHWITISNIGCQSNEMDVFDCMHPVVTSRLQMQIAALLCTKEKSVTVRYVGFQR